MEPASIVIDQDTFQYKKISPVKLNEICNYPPYNANRKEAFKKLSHDIDYLGTCLSNAARKNTPALHSTMLFNYKNIIEDFKQNYPRFDISSYEAIYVSLQQQSDREKENEEKEEVEQKKREEAYDKEMAEKEKEEEGKIYVEDVRKSAKELKQDSIDAKVMLTVEENGQEYEIGYRKEYREQMSFASDHPRLCRFIGFKFYWATYIPKFLIEEGTFDLQSADLGADNYLIIKMAPSFRTQALYGKIQIKAKVNTDGRITSMVITGHPVSLTHLFLWYWPTTPYLSKSAKLNTGATYKKMLFDETITFNYSATPSITIVKRK